MERVTGFNEQEKTDEEYLRSLVRESNSELNTVEALQREIGKLEPNSNSDKIIECAENRKDLFVSGSGVRILSTTALNRLACVSVDASKKALDNELSNSSFKSHLINVSFSAEMADFQNFKNVVRTIFEENFDFTTFEYYAKCVTLCLCCAKEERKLPDDAADTVVKMIGCDKKSAQIFVEWITPIWDLLESVPTVINFNTYGTDVPIMNADGKLTIDSLNGLDSNLAKYYRSLYKKLCALTDGAKYILLYWCLYHLLRGYYVDFVLQLVFAMGSADIPDDKDPDAVKNLVYYVGY